MNDENNLLTCPACGIKYTNYHNRCPKCGTPKPKAKTNDEIKEEKKEAVNVPQPETTYIPSYNSNNINNAYNQPAYNQYNNFNTYNNVTDFNFETQKNINTLLKLSNIVLIITIILSVILALVMLFGNETDEFIVVLISTTIVVGSIALSGWILSQTLKWRALVLYHTQNKNNNSNN